MTHMKVAAALLFVAATAWSQVWIDASNFTDEVIEGQPATLRLVGVPNCAGTCLGVEISLPAGEVVIWSFGDGSPDVVTGSARVTHTFPRGWFDVTARVGQHLFRKRFFSQAIPVSPRSFIDIASAPQIISENAGPWIVKLVRSGNLDVSSTIGFEAVQPKDSFSPGSNMERALTTTGGTVTFAPGETTKDIVLQLFDDTLYEGSRSARLILWGTDGASIRQYPSASFSQGPTSVPLQIDDDETPPTLSVADVEVMEGNGGQSEAVFNVRLSAPLGRSWGLSYSLLSVTAMAGTDFLRPQGVLVIPAGAVAVSLPVTLIADQEAEPDETFAFRTTGVPPEANFLYATARIVNDDITLTPRLLRVARGVQGSLTFDVGNPSFPGTVTLVSSAPEVVGVPSGVPMPAGSSRVTVPFDAILPGQADIEARLQTEQGIVSARARIEVVDTALRVEPSSLVFRQGDAKSIRIGFVPPVGESHVVTLTSTGSAAIAFPLTVVVPAGGTAEASLKAWSLGAGAIHLAAPDLLASATLPVEVLDAGALAIESVTPPFGTAGTRVVINGSPFGEQCSVTFGDLPATIEARSESSLTVTAPPHEPGAVDVTVTCGALHATKTRGFTYATARRRPSR
jgi:hypothetical protein